MKKIPELSQKSIDRIYDRFCAEFVDEQNTLGASFYNVCMASINQDFLSQDFIDAMFKEKYHIGKKLLKIINEENKASN